MKTYGQNIPSGDLDEYKASLQQGSRRLADDTNMYGDKVYNQTKYHTNIYVRMRYPFRVPHMQGGESRLLP